MASTQEPKATPTLPWKTKLQIAAYCLAIDFSRRSNGTVNRPLINFLDAKSRPSPTKPISGVTSADITVDHSRNLSFRLYSPSSVAANTKLPVVVYFHGGGFTFFSTATKLYDDLCRRLAGEISAVVVSVDYRLAPEHKFPAQFDDGVDTLKFLDCAGVLPPAADLSRCFLAGDSAGGNIAHHVAVRVSAEEFKRVKIAGVIAVQPFFGGEERSGSELRLTDVPPINVERTDWMWRAFLPEGADRNHEVVNVFGGKKSADISGVKNFPATVVVVGGFDPLQDWQRKYYEWLSKCGKEAYLVEFPKAIHAFYWFPELPEYSHLIKEVREFISLKIHINED